MTRMAGTCAAVCASDGAGKVPSTSSQNPVGIRPRTITRQSRPAIPLEAVSKTAEGNLVRVRLPLPARPIPLWGKGFPNPYPLVYPGALRRPRPAQKVTESQWLATYRRYDDCEIVTIIG